MGVDVDQELSPSLQEKVALVGELLKSFPQAASAVDQLLGLPIGRMRFERLTERIGGERVAERDREAERVTLDAWRRFVGWDQHSAGPPF